VCQQTRKTILIFLHIYGYMTMNTFLPIFIVWRVAAINLISSMCILTVHIYLSNSLLEPCMISYRFLKPCILTVHIYLSNSNTYSVYQIRTSFSHKTSMRAEVTRIIRGQQLPRICSTCKYVLHVSVHIWRTHIRISCLTSKLNHRACYMVV
jgi:hypothetical protein